MLTKEESNLIKGIAIILMLIHHMFSFPNWWNPDIMIGNWPSLLLTNGWFLRVLAEAGRLCIVLFAFISGYGMLQKYKSGNLNLHYSIRCIKKILIPYEITLCIVIIFSKFTGCHIEAGTVLKNICLINFSIIPIAWYVRFYCLTVICIPVFFKALLLIKKIKIPGIISMIMISAISIVMTKLIGYGVSNKILEILYEFFLYIPFIISGSIFCAYDWNKHVENIRKFNSKLACFISIISIGLILLLRTCVFHGNLRLDPYLAILFSSAIICIDRCVNFPKTKQIIICLGKYSLGIWLIHSIFFFPGTWPQSTIYFLKIPVLQLIWTLSICFMYSFGLDRIIKKISAK